MVQEAATLGPAGSDALRVEIDYCFDPNISNVIADQIQQILVNLISNALEVMKDTATRRIKVVTALMGAETVEISVIDQGGGLPEALRDRFFVPFVSTKDHHMGLGLSICHSIVESHGGRIRCGPNPEGGMIFHFTLTAALTNDIVNAE
jgi:two-component system sensor kinase FixL